MVRTECTHSTMPPAPCALPPSQPRRPRSLGCSICLYLVFAISRMLDSSTRCLGISLGRAHPKVDNLTCACMQPLACQLVRLNLHANGDPKFACKSRCVTCQLSSGDGGPSTSTWTAASCRLPAWCCTTCRHAHAASSSHSVHARAIRATKACERQMLNNT